jgi:hypothetical protein
VRAASELLALDRKAIRSRCKERFSAARMAADYVKIYHKMMRAQAAPLCPISSVTAFSAANGHAEL